MLKQERGRELSNAGNLKHIGLHAFWGCNKIKDTTIIVPEGLESIGDQAFTGTPYQYAVFPSTIKDMGHGIFYNDERTRLKGVTFPANNPYYSCKDGLLMTRDGTEAIELLVCRKESVTIPEGVKKIREGACRMNRICTSLTLPLTLTEIGNHAFFANNALPKITFPAGLKTIGHYAFGGIQTRSLELPEGLQSIGEGCFMHIGPKSGGMDPVVLPSSLTSLPKLAFHWSGLTSIEIPETVTSIGDSVFYYCQRLTEFNWPTAVPVVPDGAFNFCTSLNKVKLPAGVTEIRENAFGNCTNLRTMELPASMRTIAKDAFKNSPYIRELRVAAGWPPALEDLNTFDMDVYRYATLYVPEGCESRYKSAKVWELFYKVVGTPELGGVDDVVMDSADGDVRIYNLSGVKVYEGVRSAMRDLPAGVYIQIGPDGSRRKITL